MNTSMISRIVKQPAEADAGSEFNPVNILKRRLNVNPFCYVAKVRQTPWSYCCWFYRYRFTDLLSIPSDLTHRGHRRMQSKGELARSCFWSPGSNCTHAFLRWSGMLARKKPEDKKEARRKAGKFSPSVCERMRPHNTPAPSSVE